MIYSGLLILTVVDGRKRKLILGPDITRNSKNVQITADKTNNTIISHIRVTVFTFLCKT